MSVAPDVVFHLASAVTGARDVDLVVPLMMANQAAAVNLLTAVAKSAPATRVVLAGSVEEPHEGPTRRPTRRIPRPNGRRLHTPECFSRCGTCG